MPSSTGISASLTIPTVPRCFRKFSIVALNPVEIVIWSNVLTADHILFLFIPPQTEIRGLQARLTGDNSKVGMVAYHNINGSSRETILDKCVRLEQSHLNQCLFRMGIGQLIEFASHPTDKCGRDSTSFVLLSQHLTFQLIFSHPCCRL